MAGRSDLPALRADDLTDAMLADVARAALAARSEASFGLHPGQHLRRRGAPAARGAVRPGRAGQGRRARRRGWPSAWPSSSPRPSWPTCPSASVPPTARASSPPPPLGSTPRPSCWRPRPACSTPAGTPPARWSSYGTVAQVCEQPLPGRTYALGPDQAVAVEQVATSGRVCDCSWAPPARGKRTALAGLLAAWEAEHGPGSVKGLAPSAVGRRQPGRRARHRHREHGQVAGRGRPGGLPAGRSRAAAGPGRASCRRQACATVIQRAAELEAEVAALATGARRPAVVDEASLAGTFALDRLAAQARQAGAKVLLVGDWAQLGAVGAGGAFGMLVERPDMPARAERGPPVHRGLGAAGQRRAAGRLPAGVDAYLGHGRVAEGDRDEMLAACYEAWKSRRRGGQVVAHDRPRQRPRVAELNRLARADRVAAGQVAEEGLALADGSVAGVGDVVVARHNDRHLAPL